ncbi:hypothetical protein [Streptomyces sp. 7-21]|uniref:hypothetical protein n=1 Tax=Streptomyces sp. 7-21 TaxID=2802283 RepID=UPI00191DB893|nr:hypothetical protein [Streptomyces sp. 7-21]MBL1067779.1 hypothetical protein [Streptomyces sp. 7-21]
MKEIALVVLALTFVMSAVLVVRVVRTVQRAVRRTREQVGRAVSEATLAARSLQPGPHGEVARLRKSLRASFDSTRATLAAGAASDPALREALSLLDQLDGHARQLDAELAALMEGEPDRARLAARLPELREREARLRTSADELRFAAQDRVTRHDDDAVEALRRQIDIEASALRHWKPVPQEKPQQLPPEAREGRS